MQRILTLIRHAKSSWKAPASSDHDRPLNGRGRRDAARMAERLHARDFAPDLVLTSTATRAQRTCDAIAHACGLEDRVRASRELHHAEPQAVLEMVARHDLEAGGGLAHVAVVGHDPGLSELLERLTGAGVEHLPTCAVATIELPGGAFAAAAGSGRLVSLETPKNDPERPRPRAKRPQA